MQADSRLVQHGGQTFLLQDQGNDCKGVIVVYIVEHHAVFVVVAVSVLDGKVFSVMSGTDHVYDGDSR